MDHLNSSQLYNNQSGLDSVFTRQVLPSLYFLVFLVGLVLNGVAACIFFRVPSDSGMVVYLKNMVVADLLMLVSFPFKLALQLGLGDWRIHVVTCRYTAVLFYYSMYVGIVFMGLVSIERYLKIVRHTSSCCASSSCRSRLCGTSALHVTQSVGFARVLALLTWSLLLISALPNCILTSEPAHEENARDCIGLKTPLGKRWHHGSINFSVSLFWVTLLVFVFCYVSIAHRVYQSYRRAQHATSNVCRKSSRSIFSVLAVFVVCFVPYHVCRVPYTFSQRTDSDVSWDTRFLLYQLKKGTLFLSSLNVCLDPVIYVLTCQTFRESLLRKLAGGETTRSLTAVQSLSKL
ncbi:P2Y purinoceptor 14-like [Limanda limanda]|uniref:P2Y purinoceptor 14-like n=1 Tax=Limanda limanda TaxID=27771 RepID=UPI0029C9997D|nr:P2Y purinoceptor 14-like [Limanda limanda]